MLATYLYEPTPALPSCHAATIVEARPGELLAAWFAGEAEGRPDVAIWLAQFAGGRWGAPRRVAAEPGIPLWNPVLFRDGGGVIWLFYKIAPTIPAWTGAYVRSHDGGKTWTPPTILPAGLLGPAKNKPILLSNGDILCGASSEAWRNWACWAEISSDGGRTWRRYGPLTAPGAHVGPGSSDAWLGHGLGERFAGLIQPTVWEYAPGRLKMLMRATEAVGAVCASTSDDYGRTWAEAWATPIPNPNSGLDAVRLCDGRIVLACNPTRQGRSPLALLVSEDNGETWPMRLDLETAPGEYSYPSIIQAADGRLHIVYTWQRRQIRHIVVDMKELC